MASSNSPPPSSMAIPPTSPSTPSPPPPPITSLSPPPTSDPPTSSNPSPSTLNSPPPLSTPNFPPPTPNSPPPTSNDPPPPSSSPPPPTPTLTPPPQSPPTTPTLPPPTTPTTSPPPDSSPPPTPPLLAPPTTSSPSPPPPLLTPPPSPSLPTPPTTLSPPPPVTDPPVPSPPSPVSASPPKSQSTPNNPSTPPPKEQPPIVTYPPPSNPDVPAPPVSGAPPLPSPTNPSNDPTNPSNDPNTPNPSGNKSSTFGPNVTAGVNGSGGGGGGGAKIAVPVAVVVSLLLFSLVGFAVWFFRKRKRGNGGYTAGFVMPSPLTSSQVSESPYARSPSAPLVHHSSGSHNSMNKSQPDPGLGNSKSWFSYEELYKVTNGFSEQNLLGEGGFGCVYKGCLSDGREIAVKQLKVGGSQGEREFRAEVEIIGRVHHRHLVSLVGYCIADNQRLLVYDYVPNNTLDYHLRADGIPVMEWGVRVKVAAGAARGIAYLHEDCHPRIIHRDIKSSNILLDNDYEAQVSDFGLARLALDAVTHVTTRVMGTFGYLAPEYASSGKLTERSDVYSFGVVLLELITGRKPVDTSQPIGDESLVEWARPQLTNALETREFTSLIDPRLETNYNENEMFRMIEAAAACIRHSASMRPRMGLVARSLEGLADIDLSNGVKPGQSELFSAQSAEIRLFQRMAFGDQNYSSDYSNFSNFSGNSQRD